MMMNAHMMTPFGWIFMLIFWILVIVALVYAIRWLAGPPKGGKPLEKTALDILKERYARGDISREEFERMKKDLE